MRTNIQTLINKVIKSPYPTDLRDHWQKTSEFHACLEKWKTYNYRKVSPLRPSLVKYYYERSPFSLLAKKYDGTGWLEYMQKDGSIVDALRVLKQGLPSIAKDINQVKVELQCGNVHVLYLSHRLKTKQGIIDKLNRLNHNTDNGKLNRPSGVANFTVRHLNDILGFRVTIRNVDEYLEAIKIIGRHFGKRVLDYRNYYFMPDICARYPFRVVIFTIAYRNWCYEVQLSCLADSIWADLYHETWYKKHVPYTKREMKLLENIGWTQVLEHMSSLLL
ncbi:MAG: hypothetical protein AB1352_01590 [Patescibacteria group bacterium]